MSTDNDTIDGRPAQSLIFHPAIVSLSIHVVDVHISMQKYEHETFLNLNFERTSITSWYWRKTSSTE